MNKCAKFDPLETTCTDCARYNIQEHNACYLPVRKKEQQEGEAVNHPSHYQQGNRRECIEEMRLVFGDSAVKQWCIMTAYKYRYRAGSKDGNTAEQDHAKAEWYLSYAESLKAVKNLEDAGFRVKRK